MRFFIFTILFSLNLNAHPFYFSYTELEYNEFKECLQGSISVSSHDFEELLNENTTRKITIVEAMNDSILKNKIEEILNAGLSFSCNSKHINLELEGYEMDLNGTTYFYFSSEKLAKPQEIEVEYDLLMNRNNEQQNKLTFIHRNKKYTFEFLTHQKTKLIAIEP